MTYEQKLADPRWQQKRAEIIARDENRCTNCHSKNNLQVHHLGYLSGADPWQHPNNFLVTLCDYCHASEELFKREILKTIRELSLSGLTYQKIYNHLKTLK